MLYQYYTEVPKPLGESKLFELFQKYQAGDNDSYEELIIHNLGLIRQIINNQFNIKTSFSRIIKNEVFLFDMHISSMNVMLFDKLNERRPRKLLLHKRQISKLYNEIKLNKYTLVPLKLYLNEKGKVKIELALCSSRKKADKREYLKEKDIKTSLSSF